MLIYIYIYFFFLQAIMSVTDYDKTLWVSFRYTDENSDWTSINTKGQKVPFILNNKQYGMVHKGFYASVLTLERVQGFLNAVRPFVEGGYRIAVTGHSLGGAQATVAAMLIKANLPDARVHAFTFGSPRVGDKEFKDKYDSMIAGTNRFVCVYDCEGKSVVDLITNMPPGATKGKGEGMDTAMLETSGVVESTSRYFRRFTSSLAGGLKDFVMTLSHWRFGEFAHVGGLQFMSDPVFPDFKCDSRGRAIAMGLSEHGHYRRQAQHRFLLWAINKVRKVQQQK